MELQGQSCLPLSLLSPQRKGLAATRTFGEYVTEWDKLKESVSTFASRAGEKLREHGLLACSMTVFIQTNRFIQGEFYSNNDLIDAITAPVQMFPSRDPVKSARLMATMDCLNGLFGRGMVRPAVAGFERRWPRKRITCHPDLQCGSGNWRR